MEEKDPILSTGTTITMGGVERKIRRLGIRDLMKLSTLVSDLLSGGSYQLQEKILSYTPAADKNQLDAIGTIIILGFPLIENNIMDVMGSFLEVTQEDLNDPSKFPMDALPVFLEGLWKHPDFLSFFGQMKQMVSNLLKMVPTNNQEAQE